MVALVFMSKAAPPINSPLLEANIHTLRGRPVMLDRDLAALYGLPTKSLSLAVSRNRDRFPEDFMFQTTPQEFAGLRFQFETSKPGRGGRRYLPRVFTQEGVAMLSSVLRSARAIAVNIEIMRAFVRMRRITLSVKELATRVENLEKKYDGQFGLVFDAIKELMAQSAAPMPEDEGVMGYLGRPKKGRSP